MKKILKRKAFSQRAILLLATLLAIHAILRRTWQGALIILDKSWIRALPSIRRGLIDELGTSVCNTTLWTENTLTTLWMRTSLPSGKL
jgi:hypothetical protein